MLTLPVTPRARLWVWITEFLSYSTIYSLATRGNHFFLGSCLAHFKGTLGCSKWPVGVAGYVLAPTARVGLLLSGRPSPVPSCLRVLRSAEEHCKSPGCSLAFHPWLLPLPTPTQESLEEQGQSRLSRRGSRGKLQASGKSAAGLNTPACVHSAFQRLCRRQVGSGEGLPPRSRRPLVAACKRYSCSRAPPSHARAAGCVTTHTSCEQPPSAPRALHRDPTRRGESRTWVSQDCNLGPWVPARSTR